jgi:hypothetical protein
MKALFMGFTCKIAFSIDEKIIHSILNKTTQQNLSKISNLSSNSLNKLTY